MSVDWQTSVSRVDDGKVLIRGYDLDALIGGQSFTSSCFLLVRGRLPSPSEQRVFDAVLNAVLDYALLKPGTVAARYAVSANPNMVAGLAAAVLSVGSYTLAPEDTARFALTAHERHLAAGSSLADSAAVIVEDVRARKARVPGIGHPLFTHMLFGVYLAVLAWGGLYLRDARVRALLPLRSPAVET